MLQVTPAPPPPAVRAVTRAHRHHPHRHRAVLRTPTPGPRQAVPWWPVPNGDSISQSLITAIRHRGGVHDGPGPPDQGCGRRCRRQGGGPAPRQHGIRLVDQRVSWPSRTNSTRQCAGRAARSTASPGRMVDDPNFHSAVDAAATCRRLDGARWPVGHRPDVHQRRSGGVPLAGPVLLGDSITTRYSPTWTGPFAEAGRSGTASRVDRSGASAGRVPVGDHGPALAPSAANCVADGDATGDSCRSATRSPPASARIRGSPAPNDSGRLATVLATFASPDAYWRSCTARSRSDLSQVRVGATRRSPAN